MNTPDRAHLRSVPPEGMAVIATGVPAVQVKASRFIEAAAQLVAARGAVRLEVGLADQHGTPLPFDVDFSAAPAFRVQATAVFAQHEVVGQTEPIDRMDYYATVDTDGDSWQLIAVNDLVEKLGAAITLPPRPEPGAQ